MLAAAAVLALAAPAAQADTVVPDDQVVQGSICAGPDCVDNEAFGFDTVRLKGPVLRLGFMDTSVGAFPSNDWELTANDADGSGTDAYFGIRDATAQTTPLRVLAGAPSDTLRIEADGSVSLRNGPVTQRVTASSTKDLAPVDAAALIDKLQALPISTYAYTADPAGTRHIGPLAADFNAAFGLGAGTADLAPADVAGVALAAGKELSRRIADLQGPKGEPGAPGARGAKGDTGPAGADAKPSEGLTEAKATLTTLEQRQHALTKRNTALTKRVRKLEAKLKRLRKR